MCVRWLVVLVMGGGALACAHGASCLRPGGLPDGWLQAPHAGQVLIRGGEFVMGSLSGYADERPTVPSKVGPFWMDQTEVTNAQFAAFVKATGYVTEAEKQGAAAVFKTPSAAELKQRKLAWWHIIKGANWRHPVGPGSDINGHENQPVLLVTQADAFAYARWLGRDLPTEAEWEFAAKAGRHDDTLDEAPRGLNGKPSANYWQGNFPLLNTAEDGYPGIAPVGCFTPNAWGLYDMIGNAWEWTKDVYIGPHQSHANGDPSTLMTSASSHRPNAVIKGGSFLCAPDYCVRYRAAARESQEPDLATSHVGFRTVSRL